MHICSYALFLKEMLMFKYPYERKYSSSNEQFWDTFPWQDFFPDISLTILWLLTTSLTFPWHVSNSLTFPGFPDKWSPRVKRSAFMKNDVGRTFLRRGRPRRRATWVEWNANEGASRRTGRPRTRGAAGRPRRTSRRELPAQTQPAPGYDRRCRRTRGSARARRAASTNQRTASRHVTLGDD